MDIKKADEATRIINKIATLERTKHLTDEQKTMFIQPLRDELARLTGQGQLSLDQASTPPAQPQKAAK